ncbi:hypothetical protein BDV36DRAFT_288921 [Aspergillus pseudocaelatus]|uniref:Uncharacterized protein n=1 Tax=Aspergillus pseudocaelatus TaxID=1825620 RepID=A0ABQ6W3P0_9EURO|nr:hypothetical protein BDV36DRAFT_288921 [Aspergillus pseudocaelatus]
MSSFYADKTLIPSIMPQDYPSNNLPNTERTKKVHILLEELRDVHGLDCTTSLILSGRIPILRDNTRNPPYSHPIEQSEAYQWLIFWHTSGQPIQGQYNYFRRGGTGILPLHATTRFRNEVLRIYQVLETHLSGIYSGNAREYLAEPGKGKYSIVGDQCGEWYDEDSYPELVIKME